MHLGKFVTAATFAVSSSLEFDATPQTLKSVLDNVREVLKTEQSEDILIKLSPDIFEPLTITTDLSGQSSSSRVIFTSQDNESKAEFNSATPIPPSAFSLSSYKNRTFQTADLSSTDVGSISSGMLGACGNVKHADVFLNGEPLWLSRYPNVEPKNDKGLELFNWMSLSKACDPSIYNESSPCFDIEVSSDDTPRLNAWEDEIDHLWLHGFWEFDWADNKVKIDSLTHQSGNTTFHINQDTPTVYSAREQARFLALNLLVELDTVNEFFIDRVNSKLYLHEDADVSNVVISNADNVIEIEDGVQNVVINNLVVRYSQGDLITCTGSSNSVHITNNILKNAGANAITLADGMKNMIHGNEIKSLGCRGINIAGGNRTTLTPSESVVSNNNISDYARWTRTYNPAVSFNGVGISIIENEFSLAPHQGISGGGNNHNISGNDFHDLCFEASDSGAFYVGRSWSMRGNSLSNNTLTRIRALEETYLAYMTVMGVYLDDEMSGWEVINNTFVDVQQAILAGGGRDNEISGNVFENCDVSINLDDRGLNWDSANCVKGGTFDLDLQQMKVDQEPWVSAYPDLQHIFEDDANKPCTPFHNKIVNNVYKCGEGEEMDDDTAWQLFVGEEGDNVELNNLVIGY